MMTITVKRIWVRNLTIALMTCSAAACGQPSTTAPAAASAASMSAAGTDRAPASSADVQAQIAQLRAFVARYRDLEAAIAAGYGVQITPCLELPGVGGMGFHYGNPAFINDPSEALLQPELLLFEPHDDGTLRFVGVEYIVPFALLPETSPPPTLLGEEFHANHEAGLWGLHVWVGRENPLGMFEDWNPKVGCQ